MTKKFMVITAIIASLVAPSAEAKTTIDFWKPTQNNSNVGMEKFPSVTIGETKMMHIFQNGPGYSILTLDDGSYCEREDTSKTLSRLIVMFKTIADSFQMKSNKSAKDVLVLTMCNGQNDLLATNGIALSIKSSDLAKINTRSGDPAVDVARAEGHDGRKKEKVVPRRAIMLDAKVVNYHVVNVETKPSENKQLTEKYRNIITNEEPVFIESFIEKAYVRELESGSFKGKH